MVERTSTGEAPWTLVEANDKNFARVKILRTLCQRLEAALADSNARAKAIPAGKKSKPPAPAKKPPKQNKTKTAKPDKPK